jgi:hypothetical protein
MITGNHRVLIEHLRRHGAGKTNDDQTGNQQRGIALGRMTKAVAQSPHNP